jgi:urease accessory protein
VNLKLLQLVSPALPVGAYSYSQGLEAAVESGEIHDAASAQRWIGDVLELTLRGMEAPVFLRLAHAWSSNDFASVERWNDEFLASREGAELRAETVQMGYSMRRLVKELGVPNAVALDALEELAYPTAFAFAVMAWKIDAREALAAYLFAWAENQVLAALKSVPLGQTDGQRMLMAIGERIPAAVEHAASLGDDGLFNFAPGFALASARHETQYSRIFRS